MINSSNIIRSGCVKLRRKILLICLRRWVKPSIRLTRATRDFKRLGGERLRIMKWLARKVLQQACFYNPAPVGEVHITVTALSEYMVCPQRFYYEQYLGLNENIASDLEVENKRILPISNLEKGNLVHFYFATYRLPT